MTGSEYTPGLMEVASSVVPVSDKHVSYSFNDFSRTASHKKPKMSFGDLRRFTEDVKRAESYLGVELSKDVAL